MTYVQKANTYAWDVVTGRIVACKQVRQACQRSIDDLEAAKTDGFQYRFDPEKARRACAFMEKLPHTKGVWARRDPLNPTAHLLRLEPWQCFIICNIFGWVDKNDGMRRFTTSSIYVPRKNGKSLFGAGIGWYMFGYDGEPGAEVYSGATTEKQAFEVFKPAQQMAKRVPELLDGCGAELKAGSIIIDGDGSKFEPVIGKPGDGASPHCAIIDEYHEHGDSTLYDTMKTGMGARRQPLQLVISTAGSNGVGPCRDDWRKCEKILDGIFKDETHFCIIFTIDDGDDWTTEEALRKANPNFDVSVSKKFLLQQLAEAKREPRAQSVFKTKHLNLWVTSKEGFYNVETWQRLADKTLNIDSFTGFPCYISGDFASKSDLTTNMTLFPLENGEYSIFGRYYLPRATVDAPENSHYRKWELEGWLTVTDGNTTDHRVLIADTIEMCGRFAVKEYVFDPNRVYGIINDMMEAGVPCVELTPESKRLSRPMRFLDDLMKSGKIKHNGDPILAWAISNTVGKYNLKGEVYPTKESNELKIDPIVATLGALNRAMNPETISGPGFFIAGSTPK